MPRKSSPTRIIIDTNLWISFLVSGKLRQLDSVLLSGDVKLLFSEELLKELQASITKPKLRKFFGSQAIEEMLNALEDYIEFVIVTSDVKECRDPKDNFLLALAKDGKANYLLTGDKDLLALESFQKTSILTITAFLKK